MANCTTEVDPKVGSKTNTLEWNRHPCTYLPSLGRMESNIEMIPTQYLSKAFNTTRRNASNPFLFRTAEAIFRTEIGVTFFPILG